METRQWRVYLNGKKIDAVWFVTGTTAEQAKRSLVEHDGYDPAIVVKRGKKDPAHRGPGGKLARKSAGPKELADLLKL